MKRVLVVNPYGIGDVLFMTPLIEMLRSQPGVERLDVLLGSRTEAVLRHNPSVDQVFFLDKDRLKALPFWKRIFQLLDFYGGLRKNRYDTFFDLSLTREYAFFAKYFLWIPDRIGFNYKNRGIFLNRREDLVGGFSEKKVPEYYAGLLNLLDLPVPQSLEIVFPVSEETRVRVRERFRSVGIPEGANLAAVSCGGGESWGRDAHFKQWPPRYYRELLEKIQAEHPLDGVVFLGGKNDIPLNEEAATGLDLPSYHFAGDFTLEESAAALSFTRFALLNEGGLYHLASSQRVPVITLIGPVNEKVYGAVGHNLELLVFKDGLECRPCYRAFRYNSACEHRACLQELVPEEVMQELRRAHFFKKLTRSEKQFEPVKG